MTHKPFAALSRPLVALLILGCGGAKPQQSTAAPVPALPWSFLASQPVMVFPVQYLRTGETLGWSAAIARPRDFLSSVDSSLTATLTERGLTPPTWAFANDVARMAQRNPSIASNPRMLAAEVLRGGRLRVGDQIDDPLATQIRMLIALHEARMAILPVEVRFESVGTTGRAMMRTVLIDVRASQIRWIGDIVSDTASTFSPAIAASLVRNLANLIVTP